MTTIAIPTTSRTTNMEEIITRALRFLDMDLEPSKKDITRIMHPFFSCRFTVGKPENNLRDLVANPEDLRAEKDQKRERILKATSPLEVFKLFSIDYLFLMLSLLVEWMSVDDMSAVFRYVWQTGVYAAGTSSLPKKELLQMVRACNPRILMDEEDYALFQALPDEMTVYRGVNPYNKLLIASPSWTLDSGNIVRPYGSFARPFGTCTGKAYKAKIRKKDVFAFFHLFNAVILHPDKLYSRESYWVEG